VRDYQEEARLDALYQLKLLDTSPSESFDRITRMASQIFGLPVAAVSLTDSDRQWFKSRVGVDHDSIPPGKGALRPGRRDDAAAGHRRFSGRSLLRR
jgi:GAF domain-containing protein